MKEMNDACLAEIMSIQFLEGVKPFCIPSIEFLCQLVSIFYQRGWQKNIVDNKNWYEYIDEVRYDVGRYSAYIMKVLNKHKLNSKSLERLFKSSLEGLVAKTEGQHKALYKKTINVLKQELIVEHEEYTAYCAQQEYVPLFKTKIPDEVKAHAKALSMDRTDKTVKSLFYDRMLTESTNPTLVHAKKGVKRSTEKKKDNDLMRMMRKLWIIGLHIENLLHDLNNNNLYTHLDNRYNRSSESGKTLFRLYKEYVRRTANKKAPTENEIENDIIANFTAMKEVRSAKLRF